MLEEKFFLSYFTAHVLTDIWLFILPYGSRDDRSMEINRKNQTCAPDSKISFWKNDTILEWWNKDSLTFPQLSLLAKSVSVVQQVQLHQNIFLVHQVAFWRNEDSHWIQIMSVIFWEFVIFKICNICFALWFKQIIWNYIEKLAQKFRSFFTIQQKKKTGQGRTGHTKTLTGQGRLRLSRYEQGRLQVTKNS